MTLSSDTLDQEIQSAYNAVQDAQLALSNDYKNMGKYTITSPISGTVVEKKSKAGDTIQAGATLCIIYDLSYLTVTMNVDELDIVNIEVGPESYSHE